VAEPKSFVGAIEEVAVVAKIGDATYALGGKSVEGKLTVLAMNPEYSAAMIEVSRNQFAIPAQEETKRSVEDTKRFKIRALFYSPIVAIGIVAMALQPTSAQWIALALVGVLGTIEGVQAIEKMLSKKVEAKPPLSLPEASPPAAGEGPLTKT
jgi:energy-converting hydrogenase Eha subunit A